MQSTPSMVADASASNALFRKVATATERSSCIATPEQALSALANEVERLAVQEDAAQLASSELHDSKDPEAGTASARASELSDQMFLRVAQMGVVRAGSIAGLAAKARAVLAPAGAFEDDTFRPEETALIKSLAEDAVRLGRAAPARNAGPSPARVSPEHRLARLNREFENAIAFSYAVDDLETNAKTTEEKERVESLLLHAGRIINELKIAAYGIPATTITAAALKARIVSWAKSEWWSLEAPQEYAEARMLVEDVLALAGLDRFPDRDYEYADLLPGYAGPPRNPEPADAFDGFGKLPEEGDVQSADTALHALGLELRALWDGHDELDEQRAAEGQRARPFIEAEMDIITERIAAIELQASYTPAASAADAMILVALISDKVGFVFDQLPKEAGFDKKMREISRMLCAIFRQLSAHSGLSARDVGADAYIEQRLQLDAIHPAALHREPSPASAEPRSAAAA